MVLQNIKLNEEQLRTVVAESVKKVLSERYLEPGTAAYETDKIAKELRRIYPQYEDFIDEYVYGGYYERFLRNGQVKNGFREFVKSKQLGNIVAEKRVLKEWNPWGVSDDVLLPDELENQLSKTINALGVLFPMAQKYAQSLENEYQRKTSQEICEISKNCFTALSNRSHWK
jgi:hypothetical protein